MKDGVGRVFLKEAMKSTVDEIRRRFDADVERFANLETGQSATVDAPLAMALVAQAAAATTPHARHALDVGCGPATTPSSCWSHCRTSTPPSST